MAALSCGEVQSQAIALTLIFIAPVATFILYWIFRGLSIDARAERRWERELARRSAALMSIGMAPRDARDLAKAEMRNEASQALAA